MLRTPISVSNQSGSTRAEVQMGHPGTKLIFEERAELAKDKLSDEVSGLPKG